MKRIVFMAIAATALFFTACNEGSNNDADNDSMDTDSVAVEQTDGDSIPEITGVIVDGARRNIDLQVNDDTLNFELPDAIVATWQIGDTVTVRYTSGEMGDSVVDLINHQQQ